MRPIAETLTVVTCGSVDDGKSTLIGRLLRDVGAVPHDQLARATRDGRIDDAALFDGLAAEAEQGITIDVAYRSFDADGRRYRLVDAPGHAQYTRNMVTGASDADVAVVVVDAVRGITTQTRRHARIVRLLNVGTVLLVVTKMDAVAWSRPVFDAIVANFATFAETIGLPFAALPASGRTGANVTGRSAVLDWFAGPTLRDALRLAPVRVDDPGSLVLPVQHVLRGDGVRTLAGTIARGTASRGQAVRVLPRGQDSVLAALSGPGAVAISNAAVGAAVAVTLEDAIDCGRGDVLAAPPYPDVADQFEATIIWFDDQPQLPGRACLLRIATQTVGATVGAPRHVLNVDTGATLAAPAFTLNAIGVARIATDRPIVFVPYAQSRALGGVLLVDRETKATLAVGLLHFALRRSTNVHPTALTVSREARAASLGQRPLVLWFTGLSGAGKSTIANRVDALLHARGLHSFLLDGDNVRQGLSRDLGFTDADRIEQMRRVAAVARLMSDAGLIVIAAFISPFRAERDAVRAAMAPGEFREIHIHAPLAVAEARDPKGLYAKARAGTLSNFTGIDSVYEAPDKPDLMIDTTIFDADAAAARIVAAIDTWR